MQPVVSVILVVDYDVGRQEAWNELRATLKGLTRQDFQESMEVFLIEHEGFRQQLPADLLTILPTLNIVGSPEQSAFQLKNVGVQAAASDLIAMLDADCMPDTDWLRRLVTALRTHPDAAVISGKTLYKKTDLVARLFGLFDRAYLDPGGVGDTRFIANNNSGFRRSVLLQYPFPEEAGPFGQKVHTEVIRRAGHRLLFEPQATVRHAFAGWRLVMDIRRHLGHAAITSRRLEPRIAFSWMARLGFFSIPLFFTARLLRTWGICLRSSHAYQVRNYEVPIALCLAVLAHILEIPGMINAVRHKPITNSAFR
jgi:hypothetical protein